MRPRVLRVPAHGLLGRGHALGVLSSRQVEPDKLRVPRDPLPLGGGLLVPRQGLALLLLGLVEPPQHDESPLVGGIVLEDEGQLLPRLRRIVLGQTESGEVVARRFELGIHFEGFPEGALALLDVLLREMNGAFDVGVDRVLGLGLRPRPALRERLVHLLLLHERLDQPDPAARELRIDFDGRFELADRLVSLAGQLVDGRLLTSVERRLRIEADRLVDLLESLLHLPLP